MIASPATTSLTGRAAPVLRDTATRTTAVPRPESGETAAQATSLFAVHVHAACACTATVSSPPSAAMPVAFGFTSKRQGAPAWATDTWRLAMLSAPCLVTGSVFSATRYVTLPSPCPSAAEVMTIHPAWEAARQVHSRSMAIESVPTPPLAPKSLVEDPTVAEQRAVVVDGAVTLVEAELPHAIAERLNPAANAPASMARRRDRVCTFTLPGPCRKVASFMGGAVL